MANKITPAGNVRFVPQTARADVASMGGGGKGLISAGQDISGFGNFVAEKIERDEISQVRQLMVEASYQWDEDVKTRSKNAQPGAVGLTDGVVKAVSGWTDKSREQFSTKGALQLFDLKAAQLKGETVSTSRDFEAVERTRFAIENVGKTVATVNNRVATDQSYYTSGKAESDILDQVEDLRSRKIPDAAVAAQETAWLAELDVTAVNSKLRAATNSKAAEALVKELNDEKSPWRNRLDTKTYVQALDLANKNVIRVKTREEVDANKALSAVQKKNASEVMQLIVKATGTPSEETTRATLDLDRYRQDYLLNPENFGLKTARSMDTVLDRIAKEARATPSGDKSNVRQWAVVESNLDIATQRPDLTNKDVVALKKHIDEGVKSWLETGVGIDAAKRTTMLARLDKVVIQSREDTERLTELNGVVTGATPTKYDPSSKDHMKTVNLGYDALNAQWLEADKDNPGARDANLVAFVSKVGVIPEALKSEILGAMNSEDGPQVVAAAKLMRQLEGTNTQMKAQMGNSEAAEFGRQVLYYNDIGVTPEEAVTRTKDLRNVSEADRAARLTAMRGAEGLFVENDIPAKLTTAVDDDVFGVDADEENIPPTLTADFTSLVEKNYQTMGDVEAATNSALASLRGVWGTHYQGGQEKLMRKPPHLFYPFGARDAEDTSQAIMDQLMRDITKDDMIEGEINPERVILQLNPDNEKNGRPTYKVILLPDPSKSLLSTPRTIGGADFYWWPDYATSEAKQQDDEALAFAKSETERKANNPTPANLMLGGAPDAV